MVGLSLKTSTDRAVKVLRRMVDPVYVKIDKKIPSTLIRHCEGIAFVTIIKAGFFILGGNIGGGCVIAKVPDPNAPGGYRWSGPSAVVCGGLGGGFIFGGEKIDSIIILNTKSAVRAFMGGKQVTFGGNLSVAAGPVGRDIEGHVGLSDTKEIVAAYSYSQAQGAIIAATLEGAFLSASISENNKFYGVDNATPENVLTGKIRPPMKAKELINELDDIMNRKGRYSKLSASASSIPQQSSIPKQNAATGTPNVPVVTEIAEAVARNGKSLLTRGLSGENDLPLDWDQATAPHGQVYYYNLKTGVTQWERPQPREQKAHQVPPSIAVSRPFPVAQVERPRPKEQTARRTAPSIPVGRPAPPIPTKKKYAVALYDYAAQNPDELAFRKDEKLTVLDKTDQNWWRAELRGNKGLIPSNYVQIQ